MAAFQGWSVQFQAAGCCPQKCGSLFLCTSADPGLRSEIPVLLSHSVLGSPWCCLKTQTHRHLSCAWCRSSEWIQRHKVQRGFKIFLLELGFEDSMPQLLKDTSNVFSGKASRVELLTPQDFRNHKRAVQLKITSSSFKIHNGGLEVLNTHQLHAEPWATFFTGQAAPSSAFIFDRFVCLKVNRAIRSIKINAFMGNTYLALEEIKDSSCSTSSLDKHLYTMENEPFLCEKEFC